MRAKKITFVDPAACICKNGKYLARGIDDSLITCDGKKRN